MIAPRCPCTTNGHGNSLESMSTDAAVSASPDRAGRRAMMRNDAAGNEDVERTVDVWRRCAKGFVQFVSPHADRMHRSEIGERDKDRFDFAAFECIGQNQRFERRDVGKRDGRVADDAAFDIGHGIDFLNAETPGTMAGR
ncbi:hypothetical protein ACVII0_001562 [Sinorhizobium meliloti]